LIFLPNKFDIYCSALRNTMQNLILKNGYKKRYLCNLMKIHKAEALFSSYPEPCNIEQLSSEVLKAVFLKHLQQNISFRFKINKTGTFIIDKKLFLSLLLTLCKFAEKIEIGITNERLFIKSNPSKKPSIKKQLKKLNARCFYETKSRTALIILAPPKTQKPPIKTEKDWEYILNPLSVVNIYLS